MELLSGNVKQVASSFFQDFCRILDVKSLFATTYPPQCNWQFERLSTTILASRRSYIADPQKAWDLYTDALKFAYNTQAHRTTGLSPFQLVLSLTPPNLALEHKATLGNFPSAGDYRRNWKAWLKKLVPATRKSIARAQATCKRDFDVPLQLERAQLIKEVDLMFVRNDYYNPEREKHHKLSQVADGPFEVISVPTESVVVQVEDQHKRLSRDRATVAPPPSSKLVLNRSVL